MARQIYRVMQRVCSARCSPAGRRLLALPELAEDALLRAAGNTHRARPHNSEASTIDSEEVESIGDVFLAASVAVVSGNASFMRTRASGSDSMSTFNHSMTWILVLVVDQCVGGSQPSSALGSWTELTRGPKLIVVIVETGYRRSWFHHRLPLGRAKDSATCVDLRLCIRTRNADQRSSKSNPC